MRFFLSSFSLCFILLALPVFTEAAPLKGYEALPVQLASKVVLQPGQTKTITATFQNIGSVPWTNDGADFVSVYTYGPAYRTSVFQQEDWLTPEQPAVLQEASVEPGSVGTFHIPLRAPMEEGMYRETFHVAAEDRAWIPHGEFTLTIKVRPLPVPSLTPLDPASEKASASYRAEIVLRSLPFIKAAGGATVLYTVGVKNVGGQSWGPRNVVASSVRAASPAITLADFRHKAWTSSSVVLTRSEEVPPGGVDTFMLIFHAPAFQGNYTASFSLVTDSGEKIEGADITIPVEVTQDASDAFLAPFRSSEEVASQVPVETEGPVIENILMEEPVIRVGVLIVDEETERRVEVSSASALELWEVVGERLALVSAGQRVTAFYEDGTYFYDAGRGLQKSAQALRFVPVEANGILTVEDFDRRATRNAAHADNQFRNVLELRHNETKDRVWLINELPMGYYLRGLAETSDSSAMEFQKALSVAARTYALYHWQRQTKHDAEYYHVDAYADQVYNGYGYEARSPNFAQAVADTAGIVVTHEGAVAITPYFSRSDGRTRDWDEVWYGDVPWAKSVKVPCDQGKKLWGHGVGMSASGALCMAKEGQTFDRILKYFYTGVALEKRWR